MIWAIQNGIRIIATPKQRAICPLCLHGVISKCGKIKMNHWAHKLGEECDSFKEPETFWHINWKSHFPKEFQEVVIGEHRADIRTKERLIIEFQNSPLSPEEILERENYYKKMVWVLNGETIGKNICYLKQRFRWRWFPKSWGFSNKQIYMDEGENLFKLDLLEKKFQKISKTAFIIENGGNPFKNGRQ